MLSLRDASGTERKYYEEEESNTSKNDARSVAKIPDDDAWLLYYKSLFNPFAASARFPGNVLLPTSLLQVKDIYNITSAVSATMGSGEVFMRFAPTAPIQGSGPDFIAAATTSTTTQAEWSNLYAGTTTSLGSSGVNWGGSTGVRTTSVGLPYSNYMGMVRLVSAGFYIRYWGKEIDASGVVNIGMLPRSALNSQVFLNDLAINKLFFPETKRVTDKVYGIYLPLDPEDEIFKRIGHSSQDALSCAWYVHITGLAANSSFSITVVRNYEYIPEMGFTELLKPTTVNNVNVKESPMKNIQPQIQNTVQATHSSGFDNFLGTLVKSIPVLGEVVSGIWALFS